MGRYTIGEAARAAGVTTRAVRLYESRGLLPESERAESGYRVLTDEHIDALEFIRRGRSLGLSLGAIAEVMDIAASGEPCCDRTRELLARRMGEIDSAVSDLLRLRETIEAALAVHSDQTAGGRCVVIETAC